MPTATLTAKSQTTVPKEIPINVDAADLEEILPRPEQPVTLEQMNAAIVSRGGFS